MNDADKFLKIIIYNESVSRSVFTDIFTFGGLCLSLLFNYNYLGNSSLVKLAIIFCFFVLMFSRGSKKIRRLTKKEAIEYFKELETENNE